MLAGDALRGVRVIDLSTGHAGPLAARYLADFGASVVRVDAPPDGNDPVAVVWHRGKTFLDLATDVAGVLADADVCVVSGSPSSLAGSSAAAEVACAANPRLVHLSTPPFLDGDAPWASGRESDALVAAWAGTSLRQGSVEDVPVESIYPHLTTVQGIWAAACTVAALVERERSGLGQSVVVGGMHGALVASGAAFNFDPSLPDPAPDRPRPGGSGGAVPFYRTYRCGDDEWLFLAALTPRFTQLAFEVLGLTGLLEDPRLGGKGRAAMLSPEHSGWAIETIAAVFATRPRAEWLAALGAAGCPAGALLDRDDWLDHPQLDAIGMIDRADDGVVMPANPIHFDPPSPSTSELRTPERAQLRSGGEGGGPLAGVRVLDLGAIIAGPFGASLLGELGAEVIKVEPPAGDSFRGPGFAAYNKGQRGIVLDLQREEGRAAFLRLVEQADVVVDNYRPGVLGRLRLRHEELVEVNPSIVTLSVTGFGEGGPLGNEPGFDPVLQAMSGMMTAQGGDGDPVFFTVAVNDVTTAASSAAAVCLALFARARGEGGRRIWTSLAGTSAVLQAAQLVRYPGRPPAPRGGTDHPGPADDDRYHRVADGWVRVQGRAADPSWAGRTREDVVTELTAAGVDAAPACTARELVDVLVAAGALHHDTRPGREDWWTVGRHARFSRTERNGTLVAPSLGEHTREVLGEAGFSDDEVEALLASGAAAAR
jgi:crotonobetainyl-CoA:carnitine CoA-transferase CaiB-like acyl-CoA transferase